MPAAKAISVDGSTYVCGSDARRLAGCSYRALSRLVELGHVGTLTVPGWPTRYNRGDLEAVIRAAVRPAVSLHQEEAGGLSEEVTP